jgi:hypothetical protein
MSKPGGGHSSGISLGDVLRLPKRHPALRRREAQSGSCAERESLPSMLASASLKTGWKRRLGATWRGPGTVRASAGRGGVRNGCTNLCGCTTATSFGGHAESRPSTIGPITLEVKQTGERSEGNPHAAFDVAGAGNVARPRWCDTHQRKGETTGNTNVDLNRRASPRPYL